MAYSYVWPVSLPQSPRPDGYSETCGPNIIRTPMDAGPAKMRRRSRVPDQIPCVFPMTKAQVLTFQTFIDDTLRGTARFGIQHPRKKGTVVECRVVPDSNGRPYSISYIAPNLWNVTLTLEVMP